MPRQWSMIRRVISMQPTRSCTLLLVQVSRMRSASSIHSVCSLTAFLGQHGCNCSISVQQGCNFTFSEQQDPVHVMLASSLQNAFMPARS